MPTLTEKQQIKRLWDYGHFNNPVFPDTHNIDLSNLDSLTLQHPVVRQAVLSYQDFMAIEMDKISMVVHERAAQHDGDVGPVTAELFEVARCGHPDYGYLDDNGNIVRGALPAVGEGNWKRCHGIGNFHAAKVYLNRSTMPSFLAPVWDEVWDGVVAAYDEVGLHWILTEDKNEKANTSLTWVQPDGGWIGLAIVGRNQTCSDTIWARFDKGYRPSSQPATLINYWITLIKHELGHNTGQGHTRGGVMNPSIVGGLPISFKGDPFHTTLNRWFGGEPYVSSTPQPPTPQPEPGPGELILPRIGMQVIIPEGCKPGTYDLVSTPRITV